MARQRQTTAETLQLVVEATNADATRIAPTRSDPRLVDLVRLLARQAARDFVNAETARQERDRLPR